MTELDTQFAPSDLAALSDTPCAISFVAAPVDRSRPSGIPESEHEALFRRLVCEYGRPLYYFVLRRIGNETDAADIAQQAFTEAAACISSFRGEAGISTWIFGIATNLTRNYLNRAPHRRHVFESVEALDSHEAPDMDPAQILGRRQVLGEIVRALEGLSPQMCDALMLVSIDGCSYEEAALQLNVPVGTVRSRVSRARALMRERLVNQGVLDAGT